jgi:hypothetical protein
MRKLPRISRFVGGNIFLIQATATLRRFLHVTEACGLEDFVEVAQVEGGAVLAVAENKIGEPSA